MRHTLKIAKTMMPVALSTLVLVGAAPQVAIAAQNTQSTPVSNVCLLYTSPSPRD